MKKLIGFLLICKVLIFPVMAQDSSAVLVADSATALSSQQDTNNNAALELINQRLLLAEQQRLQDSVRKVDLEMRIQQLNTTDNLDKQKLQQQLQDIENLELQRLQEKKANIEALRATAKGQVVLGGMKDTLFVIYSKFGASTAADRAGQATQKVMLLCEADYFFSDSLRLAQTENTYDICYGELILTSISETDAMWYDQDSHQLATEIMERIDDSIRRTRDENSLGKMLLRAGLVLLVLLTARFVIWLIDMAYKRFNRMLEHHKEGWLHDLSYREYTFLTGDQQLHVIRFAIRIMRWVVYALLLYITLPIVFSIFPFSRDWADTLIQLVWSPFRKILLAFWDYLPNLFSILVVVVLMKYVIRFVHYIFREIEAEKLRISGFHADWAMPTYGIARFLLYAFMFVLIFPYLPGSDSNVFKGVSVFIGILFSLGSSTAIANMVAGLVITYMRPFKIGDRIKIGDISGDIIEKTMLVTRIRTIKNEVVTIPNSSVLTGNTTNYTAEAAELGLILHTSVTIGYDVPWPEVHKALLEAAGRTPMLMNEPHPFVLQTSLDDFYVSYQLNAYTREASKQAIIYSALHQNIQDVCAEMGIEIMSPHYRAVRDGEASTIAHAKR